jgi:hypothetical protein
MLKLPCTVVTMTYFDDIIHILAIVSHKVSFIVQAMFHKRLYIVEKVIQLVIRQPTVSQKFAICDK